MRFGEGMLMVLECWVTPGTGTVTESEDDINTPAPLTGLLSAKKMGLGLGSYCVPVNAGIQWRAGLLLVNLIEQCFTGGITALEILKGWCHVLLCKWKWAQDTAGNHPLTALLVCLLVPLGAGQDLPCCGRPLWSRSSFLAGWEWKVTLEFAFLVFLPLLLSSFPFPQTSRELFKASGASGTNWSKEKGILVCLPCRGSSENLQGRENSAVGNSFQCVCEIVRMAARWGVLLRGASTSLCGRLCTCSITLSSSPPNPGFNAGLVSSGCVEFSGGPVHAAVYFGTE